MMLPELLAPAGSPDSLRAALAGGADAVYFGGSLYSNRMRAKNFTIETVKEAFDLIHAHGKRAYVTVNTAIYEREMEKALETVVALHNLGADAFIVADFGLISQIKEKYPQAKIAVFSPAPWGSFNPDGTRDTDLLAQEYVAVMKQICENKDIAFLDLFTNSGLKPWIAEENNQYFSNGDACHPNEEGHKIIFSKMLPFLQEILR